MSHARMCIHIIAHAYIFKPMYIYIYIFIHVHIETYFVFADISTTHRIYVYM